MLADIAALMLADIAALLSHMALRNWQQDMMVQGHTKETAQDGRLAAAPTAALSQR